MRDVGRGQASPASSQIREGIRYCRRLTHHLARAAGSSSGQGSPAARPAALHSKIVRTATR